MARDSGQGHDATHKYSTRIVEINPRRLGRFEEHGGGEGRSRMPCETWTLHLDGDDEAASNLQEAARLLRETSVPVAFPTETVYGLGADATRSEAVRGIYRAKQRPSDNPLIVHIASLQQLRSLLRKSWPDAQSTDDADVHRDPIPKIYHGVIERFWPGPLTILLPVADDSPLAPETTAGLKTFGARMPRNLLALALIKLADRPIAAPSANASTRPSPTTADHVLHDLDGRIELIVDGGPCSVGVESTVVDGLVSPPVVLRPGGVSVADLKSLPGWEDVRIAYKDDSSATGDGPRAPGMKYRHYSPDASVILFEAGRQLDEADLQVAAASRKRVGLVRTRRWRGLANEDSTPGISSHEGHSPDSPSRLETHDQTRNYRGALARMLDEHHRHDVPTAAKYKVAGTGGKLVEIVDVFIGPATSDIARGLFSALRALDSEGLDAILVEGIADEDENSAAAAVMNRLRKAAEKHVS